MEHKPASENEQLLVERVAQAHWRLQRCYGIERAFLENRIAAAQEASPGIDPDAAMAQMFVDKAETGRMRLMMRYLGAAERAFHKAAADLAKAQAERRKKAAEAAKDEAFAAAYAHQMPQTESEAGFVSYNEADAQPEASLSFVYAAGAGSGLRTTPATSLAGAAQ